MGTTKFEFRQQMFGVQQNLVNWKNQKYGGNFGVLQIIASDRIIWQVAGKLSYSLIYGKRQGFMLSGRKR